MAGDRQSTDDERLTRLFKSEYNAVLAYCVRRVGFDDAEDVAAQVFAVAWRRIDEINWDTARPWLFGIARKVMSNRWRSVHRRRNLAKKLSGLAAGAMTAPDLYAVHREEDGNAIAALRRMRDSDQEILMLSAWEGLSPREIAMALDISPSAASQRLHRAKQRFARLADSATAHAASDGVSI